MCNCPYCKESEIENSFWGDVYSYMEQYQCSKEEAIKVIEKFYDNVIMSYKDGE